MAEGFIPIPRCKEGDISLVSSNYANQVIDLLNAIGNMTVAPYANVGNVKGGLTGFILDLSALDGRLKALETKVAASNIANITALEANITILQGNVSTINNEITDLNNNVTDLWSNITYLNGRMNNANISGSGSCSGNNITINVSLNI